VAQRSRSWLPVAPCSLRTHTGGDANCTPFSAPSHPPSSALQRVCQRREQRRLRTEQLAEQSRGRQDAAATGEATGAKKTNKTKESGAEKGKEDAGMGGHGSACRGLVLCCRLVAICAAASIFCPCHRSLPQLSGKMRGSGASSQGDSEQRGAAAGGERRRCSAPTQQVRRFPDSVAHRRSSHRFPVVCPVLCAQQPP
jgi:hypothetical protein